MKRFLGLLGLALLINSCDDGNLVVEDFNFDTGKATKCSLTNNLIYKLKENESFAINFPEDTFPTDATTVGTPKTVKLEGKGSVSYTFFDGKVAAANICDIERPISPNPTSRWTATTGNMEITTTAIIDDSDKTNNSTKITGYNHYIEFKNITFNKSNGNPETFQTKVFGNYEVSVSGLVVKGKYEQLKKCSINPNLIYGIDSNNALTLDLDPALLTNAIDGTPSVALLGSSKNILKYTLYKNDGTLKDDYFCNTPTPTLPTIDQLWTGDVGVDGVSGIISISRKTTSLASIYTITLNKVTFKKGNSNFKLGDTFVFGTLTVLK
jgi:hypothetical protein